MGNQTRVASSTRDRNAKGCAQSEQEDGESYVMKTFIMLHISSDSVKENGLAVRVSVEKCVA